ncbi:FAD-dependent oxidoreductase [Streptomyces apricus]|uniref:FAD-dependent oxidoreductase n=1 Tax=Streptomyces apricus TaxID=1828112 RepID=A0A5B0BJ52_9ACTN|nr:FAD-dependent oxidoreductase [Streptomyces apricus]KAA0942214.1 FAD-dependent oxidoreductase [Streptomyces apricus]
MTGNADEQTSYWIETAPPGPLHPPLASDITVDVAVIGAGIAGLSTARELARAGRTVAVLEADRIATGVTGHTTAKLSAQHTLVYEQLRRTQGAEAAKLYGRSQSEAIRHAAALVAELGIDCDWEDADSYTYTLDPAKTGELEAEADAAREAGLPARYVTETDLPFAVTGAVRVAEQAQFHPRKYLLALTDDMLRHGAQVYEHTRVVGLKEGKPCRLTTEAGPTVTATDVVVATHYPIFDRALLFTRLSPHRELVLTAPVAADLAPLGMYITPEEGKRSVRSAPYADGRRLLIITGESFLPGTADTEERFGRLAGWATERFGPLDFTHRWATQDNSSTDSVPLVGPFHAGSHHTYVATGFGGWGMSNGIMAGRLLTDLITGRSTPPWAGLYDPRRVRSAVREAPAFLKHQAQVAKHFVGDRLPPTSGTVDDLAPGDGALVRIDGHRCAAYRDDDGTVHAVSARCTHLGCLVAFNRAERAWECPCHGSRFGTDGAVLQGPATKPLERRAVPGSGAPAADTPAEGS